MCATGEVKSMMLSFSLSPGRNSLYLHDMGSLCAQCIEKSPCAVCSSCEVYHFSPSLLVFHGDFLFASSIWALYASESISNGRHNSGSVISFPHSSWSTRILQLGVISSAKKILQPCNVQWMQNFLEVFHLFMLVIFFLVVLMLHTFDYHCLLLLWAVHGFGVEKMLSLIIVDSVMLEPWEWLRDMCAGFLLWIDVLLHAF